MGRLIKRPFAASSFSAVASVMVLIWSLICNSLYCTPLVLNNFFMPTACMARFKTVFGGGFSVISM